ncbi:MAG: YifB family Mg chelatase-like AAA ATPase [Myxococcales bacterium]|nr:YifB family Mg chelatase-like AAA ATPase [Myxococcales bacterium]
MTRVIGASLLGVNGVAVEVEVRLSSQLPRIDIVGLPEAAVRESAARVRAAIASVGQRFPDRRITVNLAPASLRKGDAGLDLPIAVGILAAAGALDSERLQAFGLLGELALDGRLRPVKGALALTIAIRDAGSQRVIVPVENGPEAALAPGVQVLEATDLGAVLRHLIEDAPLPRAEVATPEPLNRRVPDLADVHGQERAKRAMEVAAAGGHSIFLWGSPGSGKTMLAQRLPGFLPAMEFGEAVEVTRIHSAAGLLNSAAPIAVDRPFRAPHHTTSTAGLLGGGNPPSPGEVSLAHRGVLFLDELAEFQRRTLEALRQVIEQHSVVIARAKTSCVFPAHFQLVAASNPCPCGWRGSGVRDCRCDDGATARYTSRISGPLLDRIDLHVSVAPVPWSQIDEPARGPSSAELRARVKDCRTLQQSRNGAEGFRTNAEIPDEALDRLVGATADARRLLGAAVERMGLSARAARRLLRVARTVADLAEEEKTGPRAIAEALSYRATELGSSNE